MPDQYDRRQIEVDRADQQVIRDAAAALRRNAIRAGYEGAGGKHYAFALALLLDELALHVRHLQPVVRAAVLRSVRQMLGSASNAPATLCELTRDDRSSSNRQDL